MTDYRDPEFLKDFDKYSLGKAYFDLKEFKRAAFFLEDCTSHKGYFLLIYSHYLVRSNIFVVGYMFNVVNLGLYYPLTPKSDYHPISPYNIILESHIKVTRVTEMITN